MSTTINLLSFAPTPYPIELSVRVDTAGHQSLNVDYVVSGSLEKIAGLHLNGNSESSDPSRADELWKSTCFEWFLRFPNLKSTQYWEFNATPQSQWNFYELRSYRSGLEASPLASIQGLSIVRDRRPQRHSSFFEAPLLIHTKTDVSRLLKNINMSLLDAELAFTAVIAWVDGSTSYFSLRHATDKPDFHSPEGFVFRFKKELS